MFQDWAPILHFPWSFTQPLLQSWLLLQTLSSTILFIFNEGDKASIQWKWNFGFLQKILKFCLRDIFSSFKIKNLNYRLHVKNTSLSRSPCVTVPVGAGFLAVLTAAMNMYSLLGSCTLVGYFCKESQKHGLSSPLPHPHSCVCVCVCVCACYWFLFFVEAVCDKVLNVT